ncbi:hypothetical protein DXG01_016277 [Tephrocybe rancida]|nr:hypothetical protein DXG01_016277 [Tephrocybe rancida]
MNVPSKRNFYPLGPKTGFKFYVYVTPATSPCRNQLQILSSTFLVLSPRLVLRCSECIPLAVPSHRKVQLYPDYGDDMRTSVSICWMQGSCFGRTVRVEDEKGSVLNLLKKGSDLDGEWEEGGPKETFEVTDCRRRPQGRKGNEEELKPVAEPQ